MSTASPLEGTSSAQPAAGAPTRMTLVRHGQTVWHRENRYAGGTSDIDLTSAGVEQAQTLAQWCATQRFDAILASPVRRALETARPCADALGLELQVVEELREVDFGVAEGRTTDELLDLDPEMVHRFRADPAAHPFPGSESPDQAATRCASALREVAMRYPGGAVLVVAHNTVLRLCICRLIGLPVAAYRKVFPKLENAALTQLLVRPDPDAAASLLSLNVQPRLS